MMKRLLFLGLRLLFNIIVFFVAKNRFPEFDGFKGGKFPDSPPLRTQKIYPRRPSLCLSETNQNLLLKKLLRNQSNAAVTTVWVRPAKLLRV